MARIKVGVLRGGPSSEYEVSLKSGENVLRHLTGRKYDGKDILLTKDGVFHENGFPKEPTKIFRNIDVVFNALHGEFGEDGRVQQIMEAHQIPYTGSGVLGSALAMKKQLARKVFDEAGLKITRAMLIDAGDNLEEKAHEISRQLFPWWVIKPSSRGSSVGTTIAKNSGEILAGLREAFRFDKQALAEEFIEGREATCAVLENFRAESLYALPVIEIVPPKNRFFDYEVKYNGETREICPGRFDSETSSKIKQLAILAHKALGLRHYSRSDFILGKRGIYILETNTLPGLTSGSLLPKAAEAAGLPMPLLLDHLITQALHGKNNR